MAFISNHPSFLLSFISYSSIKKREKKSLDGNSWNVRIVTSHLAEDVSISRRPAWSRRREKERWIKPRVATHGP